jgi:hypothetical protein
MKESKMIDIFKQAVERAAQQPEQEQEAIAQAILEMLDADAKWESLLSDPRTPKLLDEMWSEAQENGRSGSAEDIADEGLLA